MVHVHLECGEVWHLAHSEEVLLVLLDQIELHVFRLGKRPKLLFEVALALASYEFLGLTEKVLDHL